MSNANRSEALLLGFLDIVTAPDPVGGYVGGLLVTNRLGRPLEFQCTTPVRPNRTQEILYGPTLKAFLFSELIGKTLCERLQVQPHLIIVEQQELLDLTEHVDWPVACIVDPRLETIDLPDQTRLQLGSLPIRFHPDHPDDVERVRQKVTLLSQDADLREPIGRVREALQETMKAAA